MTTSIEERRDACARAIDELKNITPRNRREQVEISRLLAAHVFTWLSLRAAFQRLLRQDEILQQLSERS